ncbi:hypothetical protein PanWU01x14_283230, partial [Parasponia andersonii]
VAEENMVEAVIGESMAQVVATENMTQAHTWESVSQVARELILEKWYRITQPPILKDVFLDYHIYFTYFEITSSIDFSSPIGK